MPNKSYNGLPEEAAPCIEVAASIVPLFGAKEACLKIQMNYAKYNYRNAMILLKIGIELPSSIGTK